MSRRSSTPSVTLFPFLAVLVCAMGALILLLLVTTRRIRLQAEAERGAPSKQMAIVPDASAGEDAAALAYAAALEEREKEVAARLAAHQQAVLEHEQKAKARKEQWQTKLASMADYNEQLQQQVNQIRRQVEAETTDAAQAEAERKKLESLITTAANHDSEIHQNETDLQQQALDLFRQRQEIQAEIEAKKVAQAIRKPVYEIVAHDGNTGTERRPILIECRADGLMFASEKIEISARTLNDFSPSRNPLLAGSEALLTYWRLVDSHRTGGRSQPYVLLIVRPSGTVGFYVARRYLEELGQEFGYELVSDDAEIKWPAADPQAVEICQAAVDRAMEEGRLMANHRPFGFGGSSGRLGNFQRGSDGGGGFGGTGSRFPVRGDEGAPGGGGALTRKQREEQIVGSNGEFRLPEVEQLRNSRPGDSIDMLGPEWSPQRRSLSSGSHAGLSEERGGRGVPSDSQTGNEEKRGSTELANVANSMARNATGAGLNAREFPGQVNPLGTSRGSPNASQGGSLGSSQSGQSLSHRKPDMPSMPFLQDQQGMPHDGGTERKWGSPRSNGAIGIEREIILKLYADKIAIEEGPSAVIPPDMDRSRFYETVAAMLQAQALSWGDAPDQFMWRPKLQIEIHPGGNQHYARLKELIKHWGLSSKIEHVLD